MLTKTTRRLSSLTALGLAAVLGFAAVGSGDVNAAARKDGNAAYRKDGKHHAGYRAGYGRDANAAPRRNAYGAAPRKVVTHTTVVEHPVMGAHGAVTWHHHRPWRRRWGWRGARGSVTCHDVWVNGIRERHCTHW